VLQYVLQCVLQVGSQSIDVFFDDRGVL